MGIIKTALKINGGDYLKPMNYDRLLSAFTIVNL